MTEMNEIINDEKKTQRNKQTAKQKSNKLKIFLWAPERSNDKVSVDFLYF